MRIGEAAAEAGLEPSAIRFYEQERVLPQPARTRSGYRNYEDADVELIRFVRRARSLSAHLRVVDDAEPLDMLAQAQSIVRDDFGFYFSTIQIETECEEEDRAAAIDFADTDHLDRTGATTQHDAEKPE